MLRIPVPRTSYSTIPITLGGDTYKFTYRFNSRSNRWKLDIKDSSDNSILNGITIVERANLTGYLPLPVDWGGFLATVQLKNGGDRLGFDNVGIDSTHELVFVNFQET